MCVCVCVTYIIFTESIRDKNMELYGVKRKRSRKIIKRVSGGNFGSCKVLLLYCVSCFQLSQYVAESKSVISRQSVNTPSLPPRLIKRSVTTKAERKAQRQMQFSVLNIPDL